MQSTGLTLGFLHEYGLALRDALERVGGLAIVTACVSMFGSLVAIWTMQRTTVLASIDTTTGRLLIVQRLLLAATAMSLALNAVTPFITPDPPWLASLPVVLTVTFVLLIFGIMYTRLEDWLENTTKNKMTDERQPADDKPDKRVVR